MGLRDKNGALFDGKSLYRLRVPKDVPARELWSAIAYSQENQALNDVEKVRWASIWSTVITSFLMTLSVLIGFPYQR